MTKVSEAFGGIGSEAISAVPVLEKTNATSGNAADRLLHLELHRLRLRQAVPGMRNACMAMFFSSRVGMNSWPSRVNRSEATPSSSDGAAAITGSDG